MERTNNKINTKRQYIFVQNVGMKARKKSFKKQNSALMHSLKAFPYQISNTAPLTMNSRNKDKVNSVNLFVLFKKKKIAFSSPNQGLENIHGGLNT